MSILDRLAKRLVVAHSHVLGGGWFTDMRNKVEAADKDIMDSASVKVVFGDKLARLTCEVVEDEMSKSVGLQKYASLPGGYGMLFPFADEKVFFHMGSVAYPIDLIYIGPDNRINKIMSDVEPNTAGAWGMSHVSAVIESNGGFCRENGIEVGCIVKIGSEKTAAEIVRYAVALGYMPAFYDFQNRCIVKSPGFHNIDLLPPGTEEEDVGYKPDSGKPYLSGFTDTKGKFYMRKQMSDMAGADDDFYTSEQLYENLPQRGSEPGGFVPIPIHAQETFNPEVTRTDINRKMIPPNVTKDRFKGHDLPDKVLENQPMDSNWDSQIGFDPTIDSDSIAPIRPYAKIKK
jgi:uncharacterized membrane protein (UPF0127 family)